MRLFVGFFLLLAACTPSKKQEFVLEPPAEQVFSRNFDWDDNIAVLSTPVFIFRKDSASPTEPAMRSLNSAEFAKVKDQVGKSGKYKNYEFREDPQTGSFSRYRENPKQNYFLVDLVDAVEKRRKWRGPAFDEFHEALSDTRAARWVHIITARGHSPQSMRVGLAYLQSKRIVEFILGVENIFPVTHPSLKPMAEGSSATKARVMCELLDDLERVRLEPTMLKLTNADGDASKTTHVWEFSDDDPANIRKAVAYLSPLVATGRWSHVKVRLWYTGHEKLEKVDRSLPSSRFVFKSNGALRALAEGEDLEFKRVYLRKTVEAKNDSDANLLY